MPLGWSSGWRTSVAEMLPLDLDFSLLEAVDESWRLMDMINHARAGGYDFLNNGALAQKM